MTETNENKMGIAVITGCDSGMGESLCKLLSQNGYKLIVSYVKENRFKKDPNISAYKMDLRNEKDVLSFAKKIKEHCKEGVALSCLIHNAGIAFGGPVENIPIQKYRELFEINLFGLILLTQKTIPLLKVSKGKIILVSSTAGRTGVPFLSPYCGTKYALEGFGDSLRRELSPFGIKTVILEPGGIATPIWDKANVQDSSFIDEKYLTSYNLSVEKMQPGKGGLHPDDAAKQIYQIIKKKNPGSRYIIAKSKFSKYIVMISPTSLLDWIFKKAYKMDYGDVT